MRNQEGLTLTGFIAAAVVVFIVVVLVVKIGPTYMEYMSIKKQFKILADDPEVQNVPPRAVIGKFFLRAAVENITSIGNGDVDVEKVDGKLVISAAYTVCVPIVANLRACMDFKPSSAD